MHKDDQMTPLERALALEHGHPVDRMPIYMFADMIIPPMIGTSRRLAALNARLLADIQITAYRMFGCDSIGLAHGLHGLPISFGGKYLDIEHQSPVLIESPVKNIRDLTMLDLDRVSLKNDLAASKAFEAAKILQDELGDEISCSMNFTAPFTVAAGMVGIEQFLVSLRKYPEHAHKVLQFVTDAQFKLASSFISEGIDISTSDPVAAGNIIGPKFYQQFAKPYAKQFSDRCRQMSGKAIGVHICGDTTKILEDVVDCGYSSFSIDNVVDLEVAKERIGDKIALLGNVDPSGVLYIGTPKDVRNAVRTCFQKAWNTKKGFMLCTGCDIVFGTPLENIEAFLNEGRKCARHQALADCKHCENHIWDKEVR